VTNGLDQVLLGKTQAPCAVQAWLTFDKLKNPPEAENVFSVVTVNKITSCSAT